MARYLINAQSKDGSWQRYYSSSEPTEKDGVPASSLDGHEIDYFVPEISSYRVSGEIYARARTSSGQMKLIIT